MWRFHASATTKIKKKKKKTKKLKKKKRKKKRSTNEGCGDRWKFATFCSFLFDGS